MTRNKYARLLIVLFVPLLAAGYFCAKSIWPYDPYAHITCAPDEFTGRENCRSVGDGSLYDSVKSEHNTWFDILIQDGDNNDYLHNFAEASTRVIFGAEIVAASGFAGSSAKTEIFMKSLSGREAVIHLGIESDQRSSFTEKDAILTCNNVLFGVRKGEYTSHCFGDGWGGPVIYKVSESSSNDLENLRGAIAKITDNRHYDYNIWRVIVYPIFFYAFILISLVSWIAFKVVRFVKNG